MLDPAILLVYPKGQFHAGDGGEGGGVWVSEAVHSDDLHGPRWRLCVTASLCAQRYGAQQQGSGLGKNIKSLRGGGA